MVAVHDLLEALSAAGVTIEARNGSLRYQPRSAMTRDLLAAVKSCKAGLLKILQSKADAEFDRFEQVAGPMLGGGLYCPVYGSPEMPSGYVVPHPSERPAGVPRGWTARSWIRHLKYMGNACAELNPEKSSEYLSRAEQLEDHCNV